MLEAFTEAGGCLILQPYYSEREVTRVADCLAREGLLPDGQQLAHEPTGMDPVLGVTAYLPAERTSTPGEGHLLQPRWCGHTRRRCCEGARVGLGSRSCDT